MPDGLGDNFGDTLGDSPVAFGGTAHGPVALVGSTYILDPLGNYLKRGDTLPWLSVILCDQGGPVDLTTATSVRLMADGVFSSNTINQLMTVFNASIGQILYKWQAVDTSIDDDYNARFVVTYNNGNVVTFPGYGTVVVKISPSVA